jgi:hypothetical protein
MPAKFSVDDVLGTSVKLLFRNAPRFFLFTVIAYAPLLVWGAFVAQGVGVTKAQLENFENGTLWLRIVLDAFSASAIVVAVDASLRGERAGLGRCLATGARRVLPALLLLIVVTVAVMLATTLLIVPGLMVLCVSYVAVPVSVLERPGLFASIDRSRALTLGHRMKIFGMLLLVWLVMFILLVVLFAIFDGNDHGPAYVWSFLGFETLVGTASSVVCAVTYVRLRDLEEGGDANLGEVFA